MIPIRKAIRLKYHLKNTTKREWIEWIILLPSRFREL